MGVALSAALLPSTRGCWRHFCFILMKIISFVIDLYVILRSHILVEHRIAVSRLSFVRISHLSSPWRSGLLNICSNASLFIQRKETSKSLLDMSGMNLVNSQPGSKRPFKMFSIVILHRTRTNFDLSLTRAKHKNTTVHIMPPSINSPHCER